MAKKKKQKTSKQRGWLVSSKQINQWLDQAADHLVAENHPAVVKTCRRVLRYLPSGAKERTQTLDYLSIALMMQQEFDDAYAALSEAISVAPNNAHLWHNRGIASLYTMRYAQAVLDFEQAVALETDPDLRADCINKLADARKAAEHERALRGPDFTLAELVEQEELYQQAVQAMEAGRWDAAGQLFRRVIEMGDCLPQPWGNLGACMLMEKQYDACEAALRRALELDPNYQMARENLQKLAEMRADNRTPDQIVVSKPYKKRKPNLSVRFD